MVYLSADERLERQELDDGDPGDEVYFGVGEWSKMYHEDRGCQYFDSATVKSGARKAAQKRWLAPCSGCVLDG